MTLKPWIQAARLRTLPLAISTMIMGHTLAASDGVFNWGIGILSILTAISLQILSNLSNDYGDSIHGADHIERKGPERAVQKGIISLQEMKHAMYVLVIVSLVLGLTLIWISFDDWVMRIVFLFIGLLAIWAAINYTAGAKPYGYSGKGDISVFIFFGLVTVLGSYFLQMHSLRWEIIFPAFTCGALSVGVLNINNIRDITSDEKGGKRSIPVQIGRPAAVKYHASLLVLAILALVAFGWLESFGMSLKWTFLITIPLFVINLKAVYKIKDAALLDPYLKQLALSTSALILLFCAGLILG